MTLFDNEPLTDAEVQARVPCVCGDPYDAHRGGMNYTRCGCEQFEETATDQ